MWPYLRGYYYCWPTPSHSIYRRDPCQSARVICRVCMVRVSRPQYKLGTALAVLAAPLPPPMTTNSFLPSFWHLLYTGFCDNTWEICIRIWVCQAQAACLRSRASMRGAMVCTVLAWDRWFAGCWHAGPVPMPLMYARRLTHKKVSTHCHSTGDPGVLFILWRAIPSV